MSAIQQHSSNVSLNRLYVILFSDLCT